MKHSVFALIITLCWATQPLAAQFKVRADIDSLTRTVNNPKIADEDKIEPLMNLTRIYSSLGDSANTANSMFAAQKIAQKSTNVNHRLLLQFAEFLYYYMIKKDYQTAFENIKTLQTLADAAPDTETRALAYDFLQRTKARAYYDAEEVMKDCYTCIALAEKLPESDKNRSKFLLNSYNTILLYSGNQSNDVYEMMSYAQKIYDEALNLNDLHYQCYILNKIASLYADRYPIEKNPLLLDSALAILKKVETIAAANPDRVDSLAYSYNYLADLLVLQMKNADKDSIQAVVKKAEKFSLENPGVLDWSTVMHLYLFTSDYDKAEQYILDYIEGHSLKGEFLKKFSAIKTLAQIYEERGDMKKAAEYYKQAFDTYNTGIQAENLETTKKITARYELGKKEQELKFIKKRNALISGSAIIIILLLSVMFWQYRKRAETKRKNLQLASQLEHLEAEKARSETIAANLHVEHHKKILSEARQKLKENRIENSEIEQLFRNENVIDKDFSSFKQFLSETSPQFVLALKEKAAPNKLTNDDIKLASCIRLNMDNKQIADILRLSQDYVRTKKARLKSKLNLAKGEKLENFIIGVYPPPHL
ncbi:MAG: hypothetical protein LBR64_03925 [Dysgonamonadaceae bacterium]|jgi:hypothetical protein|nr:hypothetical protein [Dysgonamonadaceae bacterium]